MTARTVDLKKDRPEFYAPSSREFVEVEVPPIAYLAVDGRGDPNRAPEYADAVEALYTAGYAVRAIVKREADAAFVVGPLEGLWSSDDPASFVSRQKDDWSWTMLIPLPDLVTADQVARGIAAAAAAKPRVHLDRVERRIITEGRSLQILHRGPYDDEGPTLARLHDEVMPRLGVTWNGPHHEIYLGDPRRTAPERLRTVLRQPVKPLT